MTFILVIGEASHWGHKDSLSRNPNSLLLGFRWAEIAWKPQGHREEVHHLCIIWCRRTLPPSLERAWQWEPNLASLRVSGENGTWGSAHDPAGRKFRRLAGSLCSWLLCLLAQACSFQNSFLWSSPLHFTLVLFIGSTASEHPLNMCSPGRHSCPSALLHTGCLSVWSPLSSHWWPASTPPAQTSNQS